MPHHAGYVAHGRARAKYLWMASTKVRRILPHIKHRSVQDAIDILEHVSHRSSVQLQKVIKSARANYLQQFPQVSSASIYVQNIYVDEGPQVKRLWRRGRGRADVLLKRMCHITVLVDVRSNVFSHKSLIKTLDQQSVVNARTVRTQDHIANVNTLPDATHSIPDVEKIKNITYDNSSPLSEQEDINSPTNPDDTRVVE